MSTPAQTKLSILVPAFNEEKNIANTLRVVSAYLQQHHPNYEILIINDGSLDHTREQVLMHADAHCKLVHYETNMGKGYALRAGFDQSTGDIIVFFDAGLDFYPEQITRFLNVMRLQKADVVIGSKRHPASEVDYPFKRRVLSWCAQAITRVLFRLNVRDTQVGLKIFRREVLERVMPLMVIKRFAYDVELLALAQKLGFVITEAPVKLDFNFSTTSVNYKAIFWAFVDTLGVFYRMHIIHYYDRPESQREHWRQVAKSK